MDSENHKNNNEPSGMKRILRSFRHRNYRLFFAGQGISLIGSWMQMIAMSWLVYRLTGSALLLGIVGFSGQIPTFLLAPFAGVLADRVNRQRVIIATQTLFTIQAFAVAALTLTHTIRVWEIIVLTIFAGLVQAFDMPTRQAFLLDMTDDREDLHNAIALNSSMFNSARLIGPSIAGLVIARAGEGICFLANAISFLAVIASLVAIRITPKDRPAREGHVLVDMKEGLKYVVQSIPIRSILLLLALVSLMGMPYAVLMPIFAEKILHGGPHTLGFLMASSGVGALIGSTYLASRTNVLGLTKWIPVAAAIFGASLVGFAHSHVLWLSMTFLAVAGFGMIIQMASSNTLVQTLAEEKLRGRVMAFYTMAFMGTAPFGSLLAGSLASPGAIGPQATVMLGGAACVIGAILFARSLPALRRDIRPIYQELGILPKVPE